MTQPDPDTPVVVHLRYTRPGDDDITNLGVRLRLEDVTQVESLMVALRLPDPAPEA